MTDGPRFDIHPQVVLKLGEELIADEFTAIVEVAKNAYDAGATLIRIKIDTEHAPDDRLKSRYPKAKGTFSIWDNGSGMDADDIAKGWLFIAYSRKRDQKRQIAEGRRRPKRVPLGDKGIGRLGLQRIGSNVEVFTSTGDGPGLHVSFSWDDFETAQTLSDVPVTMLPPDRKLKEGTEILVSGLKSPQLWKGKEGRDRLQSKLSQMVSPFDELRECQVELSLNGSDIDLAQFSRRVLSIAEQHFVFNFDDTVLNVRGEFGVDYLRMAADNMPNVKTSIEEDDGKALIESLSSGDGAIAQDVTYGKRPVSRLLVERGIPLDSLGGMALAKSKPVSPGHFHGEFFHFDRRERASGFERENDFKAFLDTQKGVRIYRNGFAFGRYGVDGVDWLGLGNEWSTGTSWFGLKPNNIIGYIAISAFENPLLEEKTDREGLTDSPAAANFLRLVREVVNYANSANAHIRRGIGAFQKKLAMDASGEVVLDAETVQRALGKGQNAARRVREAVASPGRHVPSAREVEHVEKALHVGQALSAELERLKLELRTTSDLASLGLTAEALSHEIANIADRLSERVRTANKALGRHDEPDPRLVEFVEHVRASVAALRKQLAHLAPSLRFARERKERFDIREFVENQVDFFRDRLAAKDLQIRTDLGGERFEVRTSRGKLTQAVDNLILNSEYWLEELLRREPKSNAFVRIRLRPPHLLVSDSGPGIDPSLESRLFQPFVTLKPKGRGLGLFIVRQLLDSIGCSIALRSDRNSRGNRYIFDLDLSGAVDGEKSND